MHYTDLIFGTAASTKTATIVNVHKMIRMNNPMPMPATSAIYTVATFNWFL